MLIIVKVMERIAQLYPGHFPMLLQPLLPTVLRNLIEEEVGEREKGREGGGRSEKEGRRERKRRRMRGTSLLTFKGHSAKHMFLPSRAHTHTGLSSYDLGLLEPVSTNPGTEHCFLLLLPSRDGLPGPTDGTYIVIM